MGQTKFQKFIFTLMMCFFMVLGMTTYNIILNEGFHSNLLNNLLKDFWLGFIVALLLDIFIVGKLAKPLAFKIVKPTKETKQIKIILAISSCMVVGMVLFMSIFGAIVSSGFTIDALKLYPLCVLRNFIMALPLNLLIVSPIVRFIFNKMFPVKLAYK
ncbi:DUF2798 domain-containing protein [uncultured Clostridium sp.]|uniref:DUF2798 domain-containing protein n=1 Tax=uncultured Clostridium sp. TaxID=59620 RepID=UPI0025D19D63|nr:DUF2798 domain-containing protein [uncultured Clostridium sp.]